MKLNVHFRATVHFKDCPLSPLRIVYFGLDSKTSPLWDFWTILFDSNQDYLLFGPSTLTSLIPLLWLMIVHFGWKIWTLIRPCFQWFLLLKVMIRNLKSVKCKKSIDTCNFVKVKPSNNSLFISCTLCFSNWYRPDGALESRVSTNQRARINNQFENLVGWSLLNI